MTERKGNTSAQKNRIWKILFGVFLTVAVIGVAITCVQTYRQMKVEVDLEKLAEGTENVSGAGGSSGTAQEEGNASGEGAIQGVNPAQDTGTPPETSAVSAEDAYIQALIDKGVPIPEKEVDFAELQENVNEDIYAWIYIPDSKIDYPVLQHPTDNYYYLNYNLDGSKGYPGCIYTEDYNTKDFTDPNTVIYGHNMKNGTLFAGLHRFEDSEYFEEHPYVYIYTQEGLLVYEIFAAYESGNEHILYNNDFTDRDVFLKYLAKIFTDRTMNGNIDEEVEVTTGDRIITLSTCVANKSDRRYLVQGVLLEDSGTGIAMGSAVE